MNARWAGGLLAAAAILASPRFAGGVAVAAEDQPAPARIGEPAPAFELSDVEGARHSLSQYRGKIVVLEWTNPECPFIERCYRSGLVKETLRQMERMGGVVYLAVNSTGIKPRDEVIAASRAFIKEHGLPTLPVLVDHDGAVGHRYDARTTPHVFVIDQRGVLRYHGAYTDDPTGRAEKPTNLVLGAVRQIKAGEVVAPERVRPWGCSVKYK
jgi:peroxiredoxin